MGLSLACQLAERGANISIASRSQGKLDKALEEIEVSSSFLFAKQAFSLELIPFVIVPSPRWIDPSTERSTNLQSLFLRPHRFCFCRNYSPNRLQGNPLLLLLLQLLRFLFIDLLSSSTRLRFRLCRRLRPRNV